MTMPKIVPIAMMGGDSVRRWELIEEWDYQLDTISIVIPAGFIFDGASIPRAFTAIYAPTGYLFLAALVHDYCYQHGGYLEKFPDYPKAKYMMPVDRRKADIIFKKIANIEYPGHRGKTWVAYKALRAGGWIAWSQHRKNK